MKRDILYVDDERDNLVVFEATFEESFNVHTATGGEQALEMLEQQPFAVVIADQRMPVMTGAELFEIMRRKHPMTKRVMLTGYADPKSMLEAINQGQVYYFIKKPWERAQLYSVMMGAIEAYDLAVANIALTERLVVADRCAALGRSAARVAHEMGNQLCLLPLLELIEEQYADHQDLVRAAACARTTYERLAELVAEVKSFVRFEQGSAPPQSISLVQLVHELMHFLRYDQSVPVTRLLLQVRAEPFVAASRTKLQQVLVNLVRNAVHAIRDRHDGRITVAVDADEQSAILSVADNGCGMAPEVARRIWEPFFSTKGAEGTGLGLDVVKTVVESYGGTITCETALGRGATFTVRLPLAAISGEPTGEGAAACQFNPQPAPLTGDALAQSV